MDTDLLTSLQELKKYLEEGNVLTAEDIIDKAIDKLLSQDKDLTDYTRDPDDDQVYSPSHYQSYKKDGIDCITAMQHAFGDEAVATFCKLNSFKYNWRSESKGGNTDIEKAIWYLNKYLELNKKWIPSGLS